MASDGPRRGLSETAAFASALRRAWGRRVCVTLFTATIALPAASAGCAAPPAPVISGEAHLDGLIARCQQAFTAYEGALMASNPPEIVGVTTASTLLSLRDLANWSDLRIAERQALDEAVMASIAAAPEGDTARAAAALLSQCVLRQELADRRRSAAPAR
ncbi:MAG: hypothetical protein QOH81_579 [Sphingomonadales bacterium]|jgi:hypothetical protein|nr:hypothetical protein [Sphingomonadales bacterium]